MNILLIAALLPALALMWYVYQKDKVEREPAGLVARVFLLGALSGPVAAIAENILFGVFESIIPSGMLLIVVEYFIGVAAVEEGCKYFCLNTIRKNPEFDYVFDAVVYSVAAALGFAALENILYVFDGGLETAFVRAIFSVPGHMADGVVMGVFFGLARRDELHGKSASATLFYWLAFLLPVIEHGFYDAALSLDNDAFAGLAMLTDIAFIIVAFILVHQVSKHDTLLHPSLAKDGNLHMPLMPAEQWQQQQMQQPYQQQTPQQWQQQPYQQQAPQQWQQQSPQQWPPQTQQPQQWQQQPYQQQPPQQQSPEPPTRYSNGPSTHYSSQRHNDQ